MNNDIKNHYSALFRQYGDSPKALQWSDYPTQVKRFQILSEISDDLADDSVIDLGCGLAHLLDYLVQYKNFRGKYLGLDFVSEFIETNQNKYSGNDRASFNLFNLVTDALPDGYDYLFISGIFNNDVGNNDALMQQTLEKCFGAVTKGVAFNVMSTYVDYRESGLFYADPLKIFDFCKKNLTGKVALRHDYLVKENSIPFEFTMYLYK